MPSFVCPCGWTGGFKSFAGSASGSGADTNTHTNHTSGTRANAKRHRRTPARGSHSPRAPPLPAPSRVVSVARAPPPPQPSTPPVRRRVSAVCASSWSLCVCIWKRGRRAHEWCGGVKGAVQLPAVAAATTNAATAHTPAAVTRRAAHISARHPPNSPRLATRQHGTRAYLDAARLPLRLRECDGIEIELVAHGCPESALGTSLRTPAVVFTRGQRAHVAKHRWQRTP